MIILYVSDDKNSKGLLKLLREYPDTRGYIEVKDAIAEYKRGAVPDYVKSIPALVVHHRDGKVTMMTGVESIADWVDEYFGDYDDEEDEQEYHNVSVPQQMPGGITFKSSERVGAGKGSSLRNPRERRATFKPNFTKEEAEKLGDSSVNLFTRRVGKDKGEEKTAIEREREIMEHMTSTGMLKTHNSRAARYPEQNQEQQEQPAKSEKKQPRGRGRPSLRELGRR